MPPVHPTLGKELYFVSEGNNTHQFSVTLEKHHAAARHYRIAPTSTRVDPSKTPLRPAQRCEINSLRRIV
ncbi:hypothetical protein CCP3SC1_90017 [Gammaproteobacteria bacterium]